MRISDWSSDVCSSDLRIDEEQRRSRKIRHCPGLKRHTPARPHKRTADKTGRYIGAEFCRDLQERFVLCVGTNLPKQGQSSHCSRGIRGTAAYSSGYRQIIGKSDNRDAYDAITSPEQRRGRTAWREKMCKN